MKPMLIAALVLLPLGLNAELKPGDPVSEIKPTLGEPRGHLRAAGKELFYFERGEVEARGGVVTRVALRSAEQQAALDQRRAAEATRAREAAEILRAKLAVEGEALKNRKMADPAFLATPPQYQVTFWEDFSRRYQEVPVSEQLTEARTRLRADTDAQLVRDRQVAELEARVANAEATAQEARTRALYARQNLSPYDSDRGYFLPGLSPRPGYPHNGGDHHHGNDQVPPSGGSLSSTPDGRGRITDGAQGFYLYGRDYQQPRADTPRGFDLYGRKYGTD